MLFHRNLIFAFSTALLAFGSGTEQAALAADCQALSAEAYSNRTDPRALKRLHREAESACSLEVLDAIGDTLGVALYNQARTAATATQRKAMLTEAGLYTRRWQVTMALGDVHAESKEWAEAALSYQRAMNSINELPADQVPDEATTRKLITKANNARAAAPVYVRGLKTRSGAPGGLSSMRVGGVEIEAIPFPVEFEFGSVNVTEQGKFAFEDMANILSELGSGKILLVGHTDPVGSDAANMRLSERRAEVVAGALIKLGFGDRFEIFYEGRGEREDIDIVDREFYEPEDINRMRRRVELVFL